MTRIITTVALVLGSVSVWAQESLSPVTVQQRSVKQRIAKEVAAASTLQLPFIDDFSGDRQSPDQKLWTDRGVWVNNTFGINPYSVGVATFDAIDSDGMHYEHAASSPYLADFLTSNPIDLSNADSTTTYLSFFYQPQGNGNAPEAADSLVLQITSGDGVWTNLWAKAGTDLPTFRKEVLHLQPNRPDTLEFAIVMLPITQSKYFTDKFQFRFFNYASLSGSYNPSATINCDHWNIDFVYLNDGRSASDTVFYDIALVEPAATILKNYTSVPWSHYTSAINTENTRLNIHIRNHWERTMKAEVRIRIKDIDRNIYLNDSITMGTGNYDALENIKRLYAYDDDPIVHDNRSSATYLFECELYTDKDELIRGNNRSYTYQHFDNYYAYDDGTAENAYGVDAASSQVAYLYTPYKADMLSGLSICFLPTNPVESAADDFFICAWENDNGKPCRQLRCDEVVRPVFSGKMNEFMTFEFSEPLQVDKSIFVGWQQTSKLRLNVGWDVNRFSQSKIFYNTTGDWLPTSFTGSLMLRPIFGSLSTDIADSEVVNDLSVYPNPVSDLLTINGLEDDNCQLCISNAMGQMVLSGHGCSIDVSGLKSGMYLLRINRESGTTILKFIKK
jgi:hypothetical protein